MASIIAWTVAIAPVCLLTWLGIELAVGFKRLARQNALPPSSARITVVIPAHNESSVIAKTIANCREVAPTATLLVIADNCEDATADISREAGAEVLERAEPTRRGKGYALAFARDALAVAPPDVVIVIDADCMISPGSVERLAGSVLTRDRPAQASNRLETNPGDSPLVALSNFAMLVKNIVRARGLQRLGGSALLFGTGMAFPWRIFEELPLASGESVEDLAISLELISNGIAIDLVEQAEVVSAAAALADSRNQRTRWEHGFLRVGMRIAIPTLLSGLQSAHRTKVVASLHLAIPPLALLILASILALLLATAAFALGASGLPALILLCALFALSLMLVCAWWLEGRKVLSLGQLAFAPIYVLWKLPIYGSFLFRRHQEWNRTPRN